MTIYTKWRLAFATQELRQPIEDLRDIVKKQDGIALWGIWRGIFGVGSNELLLVTAQSGQNNSLQLPSYCRILEAHRLLATARPLTPEPPAMPGIYVFRDFELKKLSIIFPFSILLPTFYGTAHMRYLYPLLPFMLFVQFLPKDFQILKKI